MNQEPFETLWTNLQLTLQDRKTDSGNQRSFVAVLEVQDLMLVPGNPPALQAQAPRTLPPIVLPAAALAAMLDTLQRARHLADTHPVPREHTSRH